MAVTAGGGHSPRANESRHQIMGRRSDHTRAELEELILSAGHTLVAEAGLGGFSAREVARRIGYSIGTIHNVFRSSDRLIAALNTRSFVAWAAFLRERLEAVKFSTLQWLMGVCTGTAALMLGVWRLLM